MSNTYEDNEYPKVLGGYIWPDMARIIVQTRENSWEQLHVIPKMKLIRTTHASLEDAAKKFERGCRDSFESGYFLPRYTEDSPKLPVGEEAFSKIKEQFPKAYVWLEELGVNMPLKKIPIKLHRGHVGNKNQAHSAFFVAEKQGRFYYVPFCTLGKRGGSSREFATLEEAEKYYKIRCPHGVDSGQLVKDAYEARTPVSAHEFQQILSSLNHPWAGKEFEMQWGVFTAPPVPKMKKELVMGHIWGAPGKLREVVLVTRRGSCYAVMEKTSGSSELVSIGHVHSLSEANKILDRYAKRPHKEGEFLRLYWNSSAPIRPSVFLQEIAEILPDSEFLKTHELTPVKKTPEKLEEATPKEQEREKLGDFKPELHGWYLSGAVIQAESRYNGAFLLWSRHIKGKQEYGVQALGFPKGGGPDLYATTSLTDAIAHAHQVCRSQRIYHERRGESRKLDGINDFGVGISNLQDTITLTRTPYNISGANIVSALDAYKEKSAEVRRVLEILTYERETILKEASERGAKQLEKERERLVGPSVLEAVPMAPPMVPTAGEMMQKQTEAMYDEQEYIQVWDPAEKGWVYHDMKNFKRSKEGEQTTMAITPPNPKNPALENIVPAVLTESQRTILDKYQDEAKAIDLEKAIKDMEMLKAEHDKALAQAKVESRKLKTTKKKRATMMQTMSLSAVFTLLTYLVLARVFGRPVPNLQLTQPKRRRLRKGKRRHREEEVSEPIAALLPPRAAEVPPQGSRTRNRSKVRA